MFASRRRPVSWTDLSVGLFFIVGISLAAFFVLYLSPGQHLGPTQYVRTLFASVGGLTTGASVEMSGVQIGSVTDISFIDANIPVNQDQLSIIRTLKQKMDHLNIKNPNEYQEYQKEKREYSDAQSRLKHIRVLMNVRAQYAKLIRADSVASLKNQGIGGDKIVEISVGTPDSQPLSPVTESGVEAIEVHGQESPDINSMLANASSATHSLEDITAEVDSAIKSGKGTLGKMIKDQELYNSLQSTLKSSARATQYTGDLLKSVKEGNGTIGKVFTDPSFYNSASSVMQNINKGEGTIGRFMRDPSVYNNTNEVMKSMSDLMTKADTGQGTVHSLLSDSSLYRSSTDAFTNLSQLTGGINQGKGSLGKLAQDETFYRNASQAMANLAEVSENIQKGNGSLGLLIKDKQLYENISALSNEMVEFMRDFRKNPKKYLTVQFSVIKIF